MSLYRKIPLARLLVMCGAWLVAIVAHFLLCGWLAWKMGEPPLLPAFLMSVDPMTGSIGSSLSTVVQFVWMLLWWSIVAATFWGAVQFVHGVDRIWDWSRRTPDSKPAPAAAAVPTSAAAMWPVITLSLLNLLILPVGAVNHPESPTGLETAATLSWLEWNRLLVQSLPILAGMGFMLCTLIGLGRLIPERVTGCVSISLYLGALLAGISVWGGWVWMTKDLFEWLPRYFGYVGATSLFFLGMTLLICVPLTLLGRQLKTSR